MSNDTGDPTPRSRRPDQAIPVYRDDDTVSLASVRDWLPPSRRFGPDGFAVWITRQRGRLSPGDVAVVDPVRPPRPLDVVVAVERDTRTIAAIGTLRQLGPNVLVDDIGGETPLSTETHILYKVVFITLA